MKPNAMYVIVKDIQMVNGNKIMKGRSLYRTHGVYYLDGGMLGRDYQEDFDKLVEHEETYGWNYLRPEVFSNTVNGF